jgi:transcriptional regulator with XRE-family HTH domain
MSVPQNIVGLKIKALRREKGLTQAMLAARCGLLGWDIGDNIITKIETQIRCVTDVELLCLGKALDVDIESLLPSKDKAKSALNTFFQR